MLASLIAERYAKALLTAAQNEGALAQVGPQALALETALNAAPGAADFLTDPLAGAASKLAVFNDAFAGQPHPLIKAFLQTVLEHKRERYLPVILKAFSALLDDAAGLVKGSLGTARALSTAQKKLIEGELSKRLGRTVALEPYTDKALLGGAVLRLGDTQFDGSIRAGLTRLGRQLRQAPISITKPKAAVAKKKAPAAKKKAPAKKPLAKKTKKPAAKKATKK
jgi:F-type H+-transporting ATPase subunit delta